ncbi:MAG TPA: MFS transporter, partial [Actinoplanes sp.]|nr:MFS transporter [Actinoplanes sp.]
MLLAATLANGPGELLDFILPLWAGAALGAGSAQTGTLVAAELAVSVLARPIAGRLADRHERSRIAALGALLQALSCAGFALAGDLPAAYAAAVLGGIGGALLWVTVRAMIGERLAEDSAVFPRLSTAEETGAWVAFATGLAVLSGSGFPTVFAACAAACLLAAMVLLTAPRRPAPVSRAPSGVPGLGRRLRPMLLAVTVTMAAEAGVALLLLLHLQRDLGLTVVEIAYVFLPGAVAMAVLPERLHRLVIRYGRRPVLVVASLGSAAFAAGLAWAPDPVLIAVLWVLSGVAWAAVIPVQRAVVAEVSGARIGTGMGRYEAAALLGSAIGVLSAGALHQGVPWSVACLLGAAIILVGGVLMPWAVRATGACEYPAPALAGPAPAPAPAGPAPAPAPTGPGPVSQDDSPGVPENRQLVSAKPEKRSRFRTLGEHAALYAVV